MISSKSFFIKVARLKTFHPRSKLHSDFDEEKKRCFFLRLRKTSVCWFGSLLNEAGIEINYFGRKKFVSFLIEEGSLSCFEIDIHRRQTVLTFVVNGATPRLIDSLCSFSFTNMANCIAVKFSSCFCLLSLLLLLLPFLVGVFLACLTSPTKWFRPSSLTFWMRSSSSKC